MLAWTAIIFAVILILDAARSMIAHVGYSAPVSLWQPEPARYADIDWPPAANVPPGASPGQRVYLENCAICHGPDGRGNGAAAPSMIPRPRDLTRADYKYKSTPAGAPPSTHDIRRTVADGLAASGMPYFRDVLSASEIDNVVGFVEQLASLRPREDDAIEIPPRPAVSSASVANGKRLYSAKGCVDCHGADLRGGLTMSEATGHPVISRDLTAPWTFRGGASPESVFQRLTTGMAPAPMPAYADLSARERWDLVAFLESRRRIAPGQSGAELAGPGQQSDQAARGRYLVHAWTCGLCHTEVSAKGIYRDDRYLAGGIRTVAHPHGVFISRNLTPDSETGLGDWSEAEIALAIREGRARGRLLNAWGMPWIFLHSLSQDDAMAIARYLKTLPPARNAIPQPLHYGVVEHVVTKLWRGDPLLGRPQVITYSAGNYANPPGPDLADLQERLVALQWIVLGLWIASMVLAIRPDLWWPLGRRSWAGVAVCSIGMLIYSTPMLGVLPADMVANGAVREVPQPDTSGLSREQAALVERGRYLFTSASCVLCHLADGAGGLKLSGLPGTLFTSNISSHPTAGVGAWSDPEIARAVRSGVSRNGRPLYWQAMPWDHFSNFDEEDVMALIAFLRLLPPVATAVPPYRPPSPDDCVVYTAWTLPNSTPGCR
jgi:mono/diheme cytochrome c family protein